MSLRHVSAIAVAVVAVYSAVFKRAIFEDSSVPGEHDVSLHVPKKVTPVNNEITVPITVMNNSKRRADCSVDLVGLQFTIPIGKVRAGKSFHTWFKTGGNGDGLNLALICDDTIVDHARVEICNKV